MTELEKLYAEFHDLLQQHKLNEAELDYSILDKHKEFLKLLAERGNSGVTVFDHVTMQHCFVSINFQNLFGFNLEHIEQQGNDYFDARIHPDDLIELARNGIATFRIFYAVPKEHRMDYKMVSEYRIMNDAGKYVRVIEQHQPLELDKHGNIWLSLGIIDISPDQDTTRSLRAQIINYKTGEFLSVPDTSGGSVELTKREKEILELIKQGLLSKEISDKLSISVHTVNTHRQKILEKLNVKNSIEAIQYASQLGLLD